MPLGEVVLEVRVAARRLATRSSAASASGARPRFVCTITPVAFRTRRSDGAAPRQLGAKPLDQVAGVGAGPDLLARTLQHRARGVDGERARRRRAPARPRTAGRGAARRESRCAVLPSPRGRARREARRRRRRRASGRRCRAARRSSPPLRTSAGSTSAARRCPASTCRGYRARGPRAPRRPAINAAAPPRRVTRRIGAGERRLASAPRGLRANAAATTTRPSPPRAEASRSGSPRSSAAPRDDVAPVLVERPEAACVR